MNRFCSYQLRNLAYTYLDKFIHILDKKIYGSCYHLKGKNKHRKIKIENIEIFIFSNSLVLQSFTLLIDHMFLAALNPDIRVKHSKLFHLLTL